MADRVAIIGGSTVGRDHFPFPTVSTGSGSGSGTQYPVALSLEEACLWFYRIKKWNFSLAFDYIATFPEDDEERAGSHPGSGTIAFDFIQNVRNADDDNVAPTRESDLVLGTSPDNIGFGFGVNASSGGATAPFPDLGADNAFTVSNVSGSASYLIADQTDPASLIFGDFALVIGKPSPATSHLFDGMLFRDSDSMLLPLFRITLSGRDGVFIGSTFLSEAGDGTFLVNLSFGSKSVPVYGNATDPEGDDQTWIELTSLAITPIEYWPYATKAGLPVYDTATGAQLRDPFS